MIQGYNYRNYTECEKCGGQFKPFYKWEPVC